MAKSSTNTPSTRSRRVWVVLLTLILVFVSVTTVFAALTPAGSVNQTSWDPSASPTAKWTTGENKAYWEGETAAIAAEIVNELNNPYDLPVCLDVWNESNGVYAFTGFEAFGTTARTRPGVLPGGEPITYAGAGPTGAGWDVEFAPIYGYNIDITAVTAPVVGLPNCNTHEIGVVVTYTPLANASAYIVWGGHIAKEGDPLPPGVPNADATVPTGMSAGFMNGTFQTRLRTAAADKTDNFKVLFGPNAVELSSFGATATQALPYGLALLGLAGAGAAGFAFRRRKQG
jgi:hypothetical protein